MSFWDSIGDTVGGAWNGLTDGVGEVWDTMIDITNKGLESNWSDGGINTQGGGANDSNNIATLPPQQSTSIDPMLIGLGVLLIVLVLILVMKGGK